MLSRFPCLSHSPLLDLTALLLFTLVTVDIPRCLVLSHHALVFPLYGELVHHYNLDLLADFSSTLRKHAARSYEGSAVVHTETSKKAHDKSPIVSQLSLPGAY